MFSSELKIFRYGTHGHTCRTNSVRVFVASPHDTLLFKLSAILAVCVELDAASTVESLCIACNQIEFVFNENEQITWNRIQWVSPSKNMQTIQQQELCETVAIASIQCHR